MLYNSLKILHIISATLVLTSILYSFHLWRRMLSREKLAIALRIQMQTTFVIIPFAFIQLATGFTMISLDKPHFSRLWIGGSILSFMVAIISWLGFMYFLLLSQQIAIPSQNKSTEQKRYRRTQTMLLLLCALGLLSMVFFMANKAALSQ
jgi:uncharacterized membrane protein